MGTTKLPVARPLGNLWVLSQLSTELTDMVLKNFQPHQLLKLGLVSPEILKILIAFLKHRQLSSLAGRLRDEHNESSNILDRLNFDSSSTVPTMVRILGLFALQGASFRNWTEHRADASKLARIEVCSYYVRKRFHISENALMCWECGCLILDHQYKTTGQRLEAREKREEDIREQGEMSQDHKWARMGYGGHAHLKCVQLQENTLDGLVLKYY